MGVTELMHGIETWGERKNATRRQHQGRKMLSKGRVSNLDIPKTGDEPRHAEQQKKDRGELMSSRYSSGGTDRKRSKSRAQGTTEKGWW